MRKIIPKDWIAVKLTKLSEADIPEMPNNRPTGEVNYGLGLKDVTIGERYQLWRYPYKMGSMFIVSTVQEVLSEDRDTKNEIIFRTRNSIYKLEFLENDEALENLTGRLGERSTEGSDVPWPGPRGGERYVAGDLGGGRGEDPCFH